MVICKSYPESVRRPCLIGLQLVSAVVVEAITWGIPDSYGVFLQRKFLFWAGCFPIIYDLFHHIGYLEDEKFASQPHAETLLPLVGTLASGIMYCTGELSVI